MKPTAWRWSARASPFPSIWDWTPACTAWAFRRRIGRRFPTSMPASTCAFRAYSPTCAWPTAPRRGTSPSPGRSWTPSMPPWTGFAATAWIPVKSTSSAAPEFSSCRPSPAPGRGRGLPCMALRRALYPSAPACCGQCCPSAPGLPRCAPSCQARAQATGWNFWPRGRRGWPR